MRILPKRREVFANQSHGANCTLQSVCLSPFQIILAVLVDRFLQKDIFNPQREAVQLQEFGLQAS